MSAEDLQEKLQNTKEGRKIDFSKLKFKFNKHDAKYATGVGLGRENKQEEK